MEKELRKAFEETTTRNVKAILEHGNTTRKIVRELESKVKLLEEKNILYDKQLKMLENQIRMIQAKLYTGAY